jgi:hypothetical protein
LSYCAAKAANEKKGTGDEAQIERVDARQQPGGGEGSPMVLRLRLLRGGRAQGVHCAAPGGGAREDAGLSEPDRTAGMVDAASARLEARDDGVVHDVFAGQALVLDEIFTQYARMAAYNAYDFQTYMTIALKAQSQCRWTMKALLAMNDPRPSGALPTRRNGASVAASESQTFCGQTIENGKIRA